jgi:hypothetical protein
VSRTTPRTMRRITVAMASRSLNGSRRPSVADVGTTATQ